MSRTRAEIFTSITTDFIGRPEIITLYGLIPGQTFEQQFSVASLEYQWFDTIANQIAVHEQLVEANAANSKLHVVNWYKNTALAYLDGLPLVWIDDNFSYDLTGVTDADIRKIVKRCAVLPSINGNLLIKVATETDGVISPLSYAQLVRFTNYMNLVKDAGNFLNVVSNPGDLLKIELTVAVDVSVIDMTTGVLLSDSSGTVPVKKALNSYLSKLEFNGAFVRNKFIDELQAAEGVLDVKIDVLQSKFGVFSFTDIETRRVPNAGYFVYNNADITINYVSNVLE